MRVISRSLTAFKGQDAARDAYDVGLWLRGKIGGESEAMRKLESRRGTTWLATQNENNPANGGYLVPTSFANAVMNSRQDVGALRKLARIVPSFNRYVFIPQADERHHGLLPRRRRLNYRQRLGLRPRQPELKKRAIYSLVSNELKDDAMVSIVDLLAQDMGYQFALKEDSEGIAGDGTSTYGGVQGIRPALIAATAIHRYGSDRP